MGLLRSTVFLASLVAVGLVACSGDDDGDSAAILLVEGITHTARDTVALTPNTFVIRADGPQMIQFRAWTIGALVGAEATMKSPSGATVWREDSLGAELRIDGVRLDEVGDYTIELRWLEGAGTAGYRYHVLSEGEPVVVATEIGNLGQPRIGHSVTRLPDGQLLVVGGFEGGTMLSYGEVAPLDSVEVVDPAAGRVEQAETMTQPRAWHTAALVPDDGSGFAGKVVVFGGIGPKGDALSTSEVFDPATGSWAAGPQLQTGSNSAAPRAFMDAVWVIGTDNFLDGKLLLIGGEQTRAGPQHTFDQGAYKELDANPVQTFAFDPAGGIVQELADLERGRLMPAVVSMVDGRIIVFGGGIDSLPAQKGCEEQTGANTCHCSSDDVRLCTEFPPCEEPPCAFTSYTRKDISDASVEIFDPSQGVTKFSMPANLRMHHPRVGLSATQITGGLVLIAGGATAVRRSFVPKEVTLPAILEQQWPRTTDSVEIFDPVNNTFRLLPPLAIPREQHASLLLDDGRVVIAGGFEPRPGGMAPVSLIEVFDPTRMAFEATSNLAEARGAFEAVTDGASVTIIGGEGEDGALRLIETVAP